MAENIVCPKCGGKGYSLGFACGPSVHCDQRRITCFYCHGSGAIDAETKARIDAGTRLREERLSRRLGLREEAHRRGMDPRELMAIELGHAFYDGCPVRAIKDLPIGG
ncbi:MAG: hypothetical protein P4L33_10540 [Capsulimonadaceae bacterium]|nr:hypothetical protein [Capsulimonadaceae bacterium]